MRIAVVLYFDRANPVGQPGNTVFRARHLKTAFILFARAPTAELEDESGYVPRLRCVMVVKVVAEMLICDQWELVEVRHQLGFQGLGSPGFPRVRHCQLILEILSSLTYSCIVDARSLTLLLPSDTGFVSLAWLSVHRQARLAPTFV